MRRAFDSPGGGGGGTQQMLGYGGAARALKP